MQHSKNALIVLICLFSFSLTASCSKQIDATDSKGQAIRLNDYQGKWVVVNYWATWCKPCLKEIPALNALYLANRDHLVVLGVSYDKLPNNEINVIAKKFSIRYPMLSTFPLQKVGLNRIDVLPITFIISPDGKTVKTLKGPQTEKQFRTAVGLF